MEDNCGDDPEEEDLLRDLWEAGDEREFVLETLKGEVRTGRPPGG